MSADKHRSARWKDFQSRVKYAPQDVYRHQLHGWEYIPVHPFGDEPEVLARLQMKPEDCFKADAWWGVDGDATLLETSITRIDKGPPRLFAKPTEKELRWVYLVAVFDAPYVTRELVENAMSAFAKAGFPNDPRFRLRPGDAPLVL
jgi:hypothetical protein